MYKENFLNEKDYALRIRPALPEKSNARFADIAIFIKKAKLLQTNIGYIIEGKRSAL